jgi:hypothetical protein
LFRFYYITHENNKAEAETKSKKEKERFENDKSFKARPRMVYIAKLNKSLTALYCLFWPVGIYAIVKDQAPVTMTSVPIKTIRPGAKRTLYPVKPKKLPTFLGWLFEFSKVILAFLIIFVANAYFTY